MSVYLLSAIRRERRRLGMIVEASTAEGPDSVTSLIRSAEQDLADADLHLVRLLDKQAGEAT
jgi:hypothetical protein